jgi:hypothetical protein
MKWTFADHTLEPKKKKKKKTEREIEREKGKKIKW